MGVTGFRGRLVALAVLLATIVIAVLVVLSAVLLSRVSAVDASALAHTRAEALSTSIAVRDGGVVMTETGNEALDTIAWVYADGRLIDGVVPSQLEGRARDLASTRQIREEVAGRYLLHAEPVRVTNHHVVVVVRVDLSPYETTERRALTMSLIAGAVMVVLAGGVAWLVTGRSLRVVHEMAALADDWGEHDPGRRFDLGEPRDEFGELAQTLDHLLDRVERAIADERRLTDEIAHELRTPLTALRGEVQLAELSGSTLSIQAVSREVDRLNVAVTTILKTARQRVETTAWTSMADALHRAVGDRKVELGAIPDGHVALPLEVVVGILTPLLDNAVRHAASRVWITARSEPAWLVLEVFDDGPGFSPADVERVFEPGVTTSHGHGLGLALVLRMARAAGVQVRAIAEGRGHVEVALPRVERAS